MVASQREKILLTYYGSCLLWTVCDVLARNVWYIVGTRGSETFTFCAYMVLDHVSVVIIGMGARTQTAQQLDTTVPITGYFSNENK